MKKLTAIARVSAVVMGLVAAVALIDDLGKYRWFWPYDRAVYGAALLIGVLWYIFFEQQAKSWAAEEQASRSIHSDCRV